MTGRSGISEQEGIAYVDLRDLRYITLKPWPRRGRCVRFRKQRRRQRAVRRLHVDVDES